MDIRNISVTQIAVWTALVLGMALALAIGSAIGNADVRLVAGVVAVIPAAVIFVKLKTNIWILLPLGWYLTGRLPWLPVPLTLRDLLFLAVIGSFTLFFATRVFAWKRTLTLIDYLIYINLFYLATVFVRNPVGFWAMQSAMVGGRPYFEISLALGAYAILSRVAITDYIARIFPFFYLIPTWFVGITGVISQLSPQIGYSTNALYTGVGSSGLSSALLQEATLGETRMTSLLAASLTTTVALCAKYNPLTLISPMYPMRVLLLLAALTAIFLSGYRSALLFAFVAFMLSSVLRGQLKDLWIAGAAGLTILILLIFLQGNMIQMPATMQRALSWLPGDWDEQVVADAEGSSRWRFEMWEWAWNDDRIFPERTWGQGFGLSKDDMSLIASALMAGEGAGSRLGGSDRENFMITGTLHSGPLSTIKYIGVVGFTLYYFLMCYMAVFAWRLCQRARYTKAFSLALFVGIPVIYEPLNFVVIFGGLDSNYPQLIFWAGLLNMTNNYVERLRASEDMLTAHYAAAQAVERRRVPAHVAALSSD